MISLSEDLILNRTLAAVSNNYVGIREIGGDNQGQMVERFQKAVDGKATEEAWCLGFSWHCVNETVEIVRSILGPENCELSPQIYKTEHVLTMWNKTPQIQRVLEPAPGILLMWQHYDSYGKPTQAGHVETIYKVISPGIVMVIGGNTSDNGPGVVREGDCVAEKTRNLNYRYGSMRPLGMLSVF